MAEKMSALEWSGLIISASITFALASPVLHLTTILIGEGKIIEAFPFAIIIIVLGARMINKLEPISKWIAMNGYACLTASILSIAVATIDWIYELPSALKFSTLCLTAITVTTMCNQAKILLKEEGVN